MRTSLSARLMYSFMTIIVIIIVGVTTGISYLISDYFFKIKEQELAQKGKEMAENIEYFIRMNDRDTLYRYIISVDRLVGARIWLFDDKYGLLAVSYASDKEADDTVSFFFNDNERQTVQGAKERAQLDKELKGGNWSNREEMILKDIYAGQSVRSQIFHPYYKEQVILVGVPYKDPVANFTGAILMSEALSGFESFLGNVYLFTAIIGIVALLVSLLLVRRLSRMVIRPLATMTESAAAMASGDYSKRVSVEGADEVARLGMALNSLGEDLDEYMRKMQRTEKIRRDFVANVSHELRTPITIIRGYNEAISDGIATDQNMITRYRGLINEETLRLERMVRELLDIARLEASDALTPKEMEPLPLAAIIHNVAEKLRVHASQHKVDFVIRTDASINIMGNGDQMVQLVLILCDNALKYSPENGTVSLGAKKLADGSVEFSVADSGPGIPREDLPFIWERFYKVDKSHSRNVPGTGLGLAIAREIVRMHGAKAEVFSTLGQGTTFVITFPKDKVVEC